MPAAASASGNVSRLNFGLRLKRRTVRTSTTRVIPWAFKSSKNFSSDRVE